MKLLLHKKLIRTLSQQLNRTRRIHSPREIKVFCGETPIGQLSDVRQ